MFSDEAASQFKQRFLSSNLNTSEETYGIDIEWHVSATSHVHGVVNGIGGQSGGMFKAYGESDDGI